MIGIFPINEIENKMGVIKNILYRVSNKIIYFREDRDPVIKLAIEILKHYVDIDSAIFFYEKHVVEYLEITAVACFWIAYKFIIDGDEFTSYILEKFSKYDYKLLLDKEKEILIFINYNIFKISKNIEY
jgi:hypothetical protein